MTKKLILLFSHKLTESQKDDAIKSLGVTQFVDMPDNLQQKWSNVPPELENISIFLTDIRFWLMDVIEGNDYILIQGDFGATYYFVNWAFSNKLVPVYSTTRRIHQETTNSDGSIDIKKTFVHEIFRQYQCTTSNQR